MVLSSSGARICRGTRDVNALEVKWGGGDPALYSYRDIEWNRMFNWFVFWSGVASMVLINSRVGSLWPKSKIR